MIPNAVRPHKTDSNVIPKELGIYISKTECKYRYQINTDVIKNFKCAFCLSMLNSVVEKSKSCKKQKPYIAAPIIPEVLSLLMANAIRIGILTIPKIIPKPCTILFTSSCLIYLNLSLHKIDLIRVLFYPFCKITQIYS
jgi:hypothetical protein